MTKTRYTAGFRTRPAAPRAAGLRDTSGTSTASGQSGAAAALPESHFDVVVENDRTMLKLKDRYAGLYTTGFISARGKDDSAGAGGGGSSLSEVWASLKANTDAYKDTLIDVAHIPSLAISKVTGLQDLLDAKADLASTLSGYGITDAYTSDEVDALLSAKADTGHKHSAADITSGVLSIDRIPTIPYSKTSGVQAALVSGTSIKTINGVSILGSGNIVTPDTTYTSKAAASGGADLSLVTTGEKYTWNAKQAAISDLSTIRSNAADGAAAYGWGDHSKAGYLKSIANLVINGTVYDGTSTVTITTPTYTLASFGITASAAELNYTKGVTSAIQTQLDAKANASALANYLPLSGGTMSGHIVLGTTGNAIMGASELRGGMLTFSDGRTVVGSLGASTTAATLIRSITGHVLCGDASKQYAMLDSGNYNTYSPSLTGTGASGTWGINITGSVNDFVSTSAKLEIAQQTSPGWYRVALVKTGGIKGQFVYSNLTIRIVSNWNAVAFSQATLIFEARYQSCWFTQLSGAISYVTAIRAVNTNTGQFYIDVYLASIGSRLGVNFEGIGAVETYDTPALITETVTATRELSLKTIYGTNLTSENYSGYVPTFTGQGATGTWNINVSGTAKALTPNNHTYAQCPTIGDLKASLIANMATGGDVAYPVQSYNFQGSNVLSLKNNWATDSYAVGDGSRTSFLRLDRYASGSYGTFLMSGMSIDPLAGISRLTLFNSKWYGPYLLLDEANYSSYALPLTGGTISGELTVAGDVLHLGNSATANLYMQRNNANYIWASKTGGWLCLGTVDGGNTSSLNSGINIKGKQVFIGGTLTGTAALNVAGVAYASTGIYSDGYVSARGVDSSSDERLKTDIKPLANALDYILGTKYRSFRWKEDGKPCIGVIAQEELGREHGYLVEKHNDCYSYNYAATTALLGAALQEEDDKVERLKARIAALEAELERLKYNS